MWYFDDSLLWMTSVTYLNSLCNIKSVGPDEIQGDFSFKLRDVIAWPFFRLFQKSLTSGVLPTALKIGTIASILKSSDPKMFSNYHPITIISHYFKSHLLFEEFCTGKNFMKF